MSSIVRLLIIYLVALYSPNYYAFNSTTRSRLLDAFNFIVMQQNSNCRGAYTVVEIGDYSYGGGFASQFQLAALYWVRTAAYQNYSLPVLIRGHIRSYSDGKECERVNHDWTCFFQPMSACQDELLNYGTKISSPMLHSSSYSSLVPSRFNDMGLEWWWGAVQLYMFRLQPEVEYFVLHESSRMSEGRGFPFGSLIAGLHVRHGDKSIDGWRLHSFENEMAAVRKSPDCALDGMTNSSRKTEGICHPSTLNVSHIAAEDRDLHVFVASDDPNVLNAAHKLGHLVDSSGVSQKTGTAGMFAVLIKHPEYGYNATLEIVTDIYFLSHCTTLVGTAASQVFRMAVDMSYANGTLNCAIALDYNQLPKIRRMSAKYELIVPEHFEAP